MVLFVRCCLALPLLLLAVSRPAAAASRTTPPYLRTSLDDAAPVAPPSQPRRIRSSLDDLSVTATLGSAGSPSHIVFPLEVAGRLIRLSLDEGQVSYGHLVLARPQPRRIRTTLD
jgi:hypothetical protein